MTTTRIIVSIVGAIAAFGYVATAISVEGQLEDRRRRDAPPVPTWNWGRFRYLSNPANLQPESESLVRRYKRLWSGSILVVAGWLLLFPWLIGW